MNGKIEKSISCAASFTVGQPIAMQTTVLASSQLYAQKENKTDKTTNNIIFKKFGFKKFRVIYFIDNILYLC